MNPSDIATATPAMTRVIANTSVLGEYPAVSIVVIVMIIVIIIFSNYDNCYSGTPPSNADTIGTNNFICCSEVSLAQGLVVDHAPPTIVASYDKA